MSISPNLLLPSFSFMLRANKRTDVLMPAKMVQMDEGMLKITDAVDDWLLHDAIKADRTKIVRFALRELFARDPGDVQQAYRLTMLGEMHGLHIHEPSHGD